ncbi:MAG: hypothetical protein RL594_577 [Bacteroidota bacterium]|jgi:hypothetical protein
MRTPFMLIVMLFMTFGIVTAQDERLDELNFDEEPLPEETVSYSAIGIGPAVNIFMPKVDDINAFAATQGLGSMDSPMVLVGAEFFTAIGIVPNARIGFSWLTGSVGTMKDVPSVGGNPETRSLDYSISTRALHLEYAIVPAAKLAILPGVAVVWGYSTITSSRSSGNFDWTSTAPAATTQQVLGQSALSIMPRLSIEYAVTPFLNIRAQGAYSAQLSASDWTANTHAGAVNVPTSIAVSGLSAQIGVFVGLFN